MRKPTKKQINEFFTKMLKKEIKAYFKRIRFTPYENSYTLDFFSPSGFFFLWKWSINQPWWWEFCCRKIYSEPCWINLEKCDYDGYLPVEVINPKVFAREIYESRLWAKTGK